MLHSSTWDTNQGLILPSLLRQSLEDEAFTLMVKTVHLTHSVILCCLLVMTLPPFVMTGTETESVHASTRHGINAMGNRTSKQHLGSLYKSRDIEVHRNMVTIFPLA